MIALGLTRTVATDVYFRQTAVYLQVLLIRNMRVFGSCSLFVSVMIFQTHLKLK
jgi:hypothetical protein